MPRPTFDVSRWSVGLKLTTFTFALVGVIIASIVLTMSITATTKLKERSVESTRAELASLINAIGLFDSGMSGQAASFGHVFAAGFEGERALDPAQSIDVAGKATPALLLNGKPVNLDYTLPDRFTRLTGGNATVFVASGDDFIRISTSVRKENGDRAVGTVLDKTGAAYAALHEGRPYVGIARLFGKDFITDYEPLRDTAGKLVGALYVGIDVSKDMAVLRDRIRAMKVGDTGYFFVMDAKAGKTYGDVVVHPAKEGKNILDSRDASGRQFIREMLTTGEGVITYPWQNAEKGETSPRDKIVAYATYKNWGWMVAGGTYTDEITKEADKLRTRFIVIGLAALAIFALTLRTVINRTISKPLEQARDAAARIAGGDLTVRIATKRQDEIGLLLNAMNDISSRLSGVVGQVRLGAEQIAGASGEISSGNLDLCSRTEQQAATLASTAEAMRDLTETVRRNAGDAQDANQLAVNTSLVAEEGGRMVAEVTRTMDSIRASSGRHHRGHRRHRLPDQHPGAERRRRSGARR
jgi:methyl-accepting chemotaxis protein